MRKANMNRWRNQSMRKQFITEKGYKYEDGKWVFGDEKAGGKVGEPIPKELWNKKTRRISLKSQQYEEWLGKNPQANQNAEKYAEARSKLTDKGEINEFRESTPGGKFCNYFLLFIYLYSLCIDILLVLFS